MYVLGNIMSCMYLSFSGQCCSITVKAKKRGPEMSSLNV